MQGVGKSLTGEKSMNSNGMEKFLRGISRAVESGIERAGQHEEAVRESFHEIQNQMKEHEKSFEDMRARVRGKLHAGARRTHGDPV